MSGQPAVTTSLVHAAEEVVEKVPEAYLLRTGTGTVLLGLVSIHVLLLFIVCVLCIVYYCTILYSCTGT